MGKPLASAVGVCSMCGKPLNAKGDCLACLLRTGLEETTEETKPAVLAFGDFEVEQRADGSCWELGHGAIGVTYLASDRVLRRRVALKVIEVPAAARGSQAVRDRFLREARAAAALRHPNVAAVFQFGTSQMLLTAITRWNSSKVKRWRHTYAGMVRLTQRRLLRLRCKLRER